MEFSEQQQPEVRRRGQKTNCPIRSILRAALLYAIVDYAHLGVMRHRQWCRSGREWVRHIPRKKGGFYNRMPQIYQEVREKVEWLFSPQFEDLVEMFNLDLEYARTLFLRLMAGPSEDE